MICEERNFLDGVINRDTDEIFCATEEINDPNFVVDVEKNVICDQKNLTEDKASNDREKVNDVFKEICDEN